MQTVEDNFKGAIVISDEEYEEGTSDEEEEDESEVSIKDSLVISFDPGTANLGIVHGYVTFNTKKDKKKVYAIWSKQASTSMSICEIKDELPRMYHLLNLHLHNAGIFRLPGIETAMIIIEEQFFNPVNQVPTLRQVYTIQVLLYAIFREKFPGATVRLLKSATVKKKLGIASGNHDKNKELAVEFAREQLGVDTKNNHVADAWNQIFYVFQHEIYEGQGRRKAGRKEVVFQFEN